MTKGPFASNGVKSRANPCRIHNQLNESPPCHLFRPIDIIDPQVRFEAHQRRVLFNIRGKSTKETLLLWCSKEILSLSDHNLLESPMARIPWPIIRGHRQEQPLIFKRITHFANSGSYLANIR